VWQRGFALSVWRYGSTNLPLPPPPPPPLEQEALVADDGGLPFRVLTPADDGDASLPPCVPATFCRLSRLQHKAQPHIAPAHAQQRWLGQSWPAYTLNTGLRAVLPRPDCSASRSGTTVPCARDAHARFASARALMV